MIISKNVQSSAFYANLLAINCLGMVKLSSLLAKKICWSVTLSGRRQRSNMFERQMWVSDCHSTVVPL